jgi:hypothetical protein
MVLIQLPNETDCETSPTPPAVDCSEYLRDDLLDRLRWEVFGPLDEIKIKDMQHNTLTPFSKDDNIASQALWNPPSTKAPLKKLSVYIDVCEEKHCQDSHDEEYRYQSPEPLVITKDDGMPVSMYDFVSQVHAYLGANKHEIWQCEDEMYMGPPVDMSNGLKYVGIGPDDNGHIGDDDIEDACAEECTCYEPNHSWRSGDIPKGSRVFFDSAMMAEADVDEYSISVGLFVEGNYGESLPKFWERRDGR